MNKLELEYDYETDEDQMYKAKELLIRETVQAVQFFVTDDPELLVGNLAGCNWFWNQLISNTILFYSNWFLTMTQMFKR